MGGSMSVDILDRIYDAYAGEMGQQFMRETQRRIHWMCSVVRGERVLDVGCSQGLVPILLGREGKATIGIDSSNAAIRSAEEHLVRESVGVRKLVNFVEADFVTHDFGATCFDSIIIGEVLEHLLQPERFVSTAARLLEPGGRLIVTVPFGINDHFDHKHTFYLLEPYRLLREHFDIVDVTLLGKWLGLVGTRRPSATEAVRPSWSDDHLMRLEAAFNAVERGLVDDVTELRARLDDANTKYRNSSEEIARLKRESAHHETERKAAERARSQLETQLSELSGAHGGEGNPELARLQAELASQRELLQTRSVTLARLEERLGHADQLRQLELGIRDSEITRLQRDRSELESQLHGAEMRLVGVEERTARDAQTRDQEMARLTAELEAATTQATNREHQIASLEFERTELEQAHAQQVDELRQKLTRSEEHAATLAGRVLELEEQGGARSALYETAQLQFEAAAQQANATAQELAEAHRKLENALAQLQSERESAAQRERELARAPKATEEPDPERRALEHELQLLRNLQRDLERRQEHLRQQLAGASQAERRLARQLEQERRARAHAERQIVQTRNTLSFQLGYELIHGFKSKDKLIALPQTLWALQKEATRRRSERAPRTGASPAGLAATTTDVEPEPLKATRTVPPFTQPGATAKAPADAQAAPQSRSTPRGVTPPQTPRLDGGVSQLRVACIHDEFTFSSYAPECQSLQLTPSGWRQELETFSPQLLFVESAWRGKDDLWGKKISHRAQELMDVVDWCRAQGVPTVFWNKEDPVHFSTFVNTAKLFDFVFTTDLDCIQRYKQALGHEQVFLLPFACQPAQHNPIEKYQRKEALCFAGAYYARYPDRQEDFASFADNFEMPPRLEVYDRNHGKNDPNYAFPEEYRPLIVGTLPFNEIDRAYKGYRYALNLNSVKGSQTMFARRVFELLGSNTLTLSNFSRGIRLMFGDLVITTDSGQRARERLRALTEDDGQLRRVRLAALRKTMQEHTYGQRLRFVASRVWRHEPPDDLPRVTVLGCAADAPSARALIDCFQRQTYVNKTLVLVLPEAVTIGGAFSSVPLKRMTPDAARTLRIADVASEGYVASFSNRDHYGESYLLDLALTTRYSRAAVIGKSAHYALGPSETLTLSNDGAQYRQARALAARASILRQDICGTFLLGDWLSQLDEREVEHDNCLAVDEFNYCRNGAGLPRTLLEVVEDLADLDVGLSVRELTPSIAPTSSKARARQQPRLTGQRLAELFKASTSKGVSLSVENGAFLVHSSLGDEKHEYVYASKICSPSELGFPGPGHFHLEANPGLNVHMALVFLDERKQKLGNKLCPAARNETVTLPDQTAFIQLALRVYGSGNCSINALLLDHVSEAPEHLFGRADYLLVTNHYPADNDLYRNGFVHRRVTDYRRQGTRVDVFRHRPGEKLGFREYEGVDVISGGNDALATLLRSNNYKAVLVHFLDPALWQILRDCAKSARLLVWLHGFEVQAWHRRSFNYASEAERDAARLKSEKRDVFWRGVLNDMPESGKLIFVSEHFLLQTLGDLGLPPAHPRCTVIHNLIDGNLFGYQPKSTEQRKRILSIRPFVSPKYANDLTVAAILELKKRPFFEDLWFHLIGDGPLFEQTVAPLRGLRNVQLDQGFISQREIAALHQSYGIFLCPTRDDTQGVSRDEAMASGLVPITNRTSAIPEFVDDECGILAEPEAFVGLAEGIARLYEAPALFSRLSQRAAERVRAQSGPRQTTERELELILGRFR